ncbi:MAG: alpha/beta fold hydrolase [Burkholderiales bacterium]|nr:MAG: alpha/beta fold hydrolase [Burkholderiales bacterium]
MAGSDTQQIRFCTADDGARIAYATIGAGPPVVRAAHWLSHLEFDWKSPIWRPWLTEFARGRTLVRYDERACGLSDWQVGEISFEAWLADLEAVVSAAGLARFALFGMSQGAAVAIAYAVRHPQRVSHLVLVGGFARGRFHRGQPQLADEVRLELDLMRIGWGRENPAFRRHFTSQFLPDGSLEQIRWFDDLQRVSASAENAARILETGSQVDVVDLLTQVRVPTLVLHAREDARIPFEEGRLMASAIPGARFVPLESRNHVLLDTDPAWPRFWQELRSFLGTGEVAAGDRAAPAFPTLTAREQQVLELLARGLANEEIAERLGIAAKTVRNQVSAIFDKLQVSTRAQAIVSAREAGLGRPE